MVTPSPSDALSQAIDLLNEASHHVPEFSALDRRIHAALPTLRAAAADPAPTDPVVEIERLRTALASVIDPPFSAYYQWLMVGNAEAADRMEEWEQKRAAACAVLAADPAPTDPSVRQLEDAVLTLWAEMPADGTRAVADDYPALATFIRHLHHSIEHEQAMVRHNTWATDPAPTDPTVCDDCNGDGGWWEGPQGGRTWVPCSNEGCPALDMPGPDTTEGGW